MDDVVLIACGGAASRIVSERAWSIPVEVLNPGAEDDSPEALDAAASEAADSVAGSLDGRRIAFVYAVLGGRLGGRIMSEVAVRAKVAGCRVVAVVGIPMPFERDRRGRAAGFILELAQAADRTLLLDEAVVWSLSPPETKFRAFLGATANTLAFAVENLSWMAEGPFFSTMSQRAYTYACVTDFVPADAASRAVRAAAYPVDLSKEGAVVAVGSGVTDGQIEDLSERMAAETGTVPDVVRRADAEDTKVLVFLPV